MNKPIRWMATGKGFRWNSDRGVREAEGGDSPEMMALDYIIELGPVFHTSVLDTLGDMDIPQKRAEEVVIALYHKEYIERV